MIILKENIHFKLLYLIYTSNILSTGITLTLQRSLHNRRSSRRASLCTCQMLNLRDYHFYLFPNAMRRRTPLKERTDTNSNQSKIKIKYLVHKYYHVYFTKLLLLSIAHNIAVNPNSPEQNNIVR